MMCDYSALSHGVRNVTHQPFFYAPLTPADDAYEHRSFITIIRVSGSDSPAVSLHITLTVVKFRFFLVMLAQSIQCITRLETHL
jgi:hypothetical protein